MKNITKIIATPEQMYQYGYECASIYPKILLNGELGAGKTTFTKGVAHALGIDPSSVHSPTFTYVNEYDEKMVHLDMYRLETEQDALYKGIFDIIDDHDHVVIERPKWTEQYVEGGWIQIDIEKQGMERVISLKII